MILFATEVKIASMNLLKTFKPNLATILFHDIILIKSKVPNYGDVKDGIKDNGSQNGPNSGL